MTAGEPGIGWVSQVGENDGETIWAYDLRGASAPDKNAYCKAKHNCAFAYSPGEFSRGERGGLEFSGGQFKNPGELIYKQSVVACNLWAYFDGLL